MTTTSSIIVNCGACACDIKQYFVWAGIDVHFRKIRPGEKIGNYGDYLFESVPTVEAVFLVLKYPGFVRGLL